MAYSSDTTDLQAYLDFVASAQETVRAFQDSTNNEGMQDNVILLQYAMDCVGYQAGSLPSGQHTPASWLTTAVPEGSVSESVYSQQEPQVLSLHHRVKYLNVYPNLRPDAVSACPHIIDLSSIDPSIPQKGFGFADLAVTVLFNYDAAVLDVFLNVGKKKFDFRRISSNGNDLTFFIERRKKFVTIGFLKAGCKTIQDAVSYKILDEATGPWGPLAVQGSLCHNVIGHGLIEKYVRGTFVKTVLMQRLWEGDDSINFVVKAR